MLTTENALALPKGQIAVVFAEGCLVEATFTPENVVDCVNLCKENNVDKDFYSQAGIIAEGGRLGWGLGNCYKVV